jgi:hypothetical protein
MPPRTELTPERKAALRVELQIFRTAVRRAEEDLKVHVSRASEVGMSLREIADALGMKSADTAARWKAEGDEARDRRRGGDD